MLPLDLSKKFVAAANFEAAREWAAADVPVIGKTDFAAVVGGIGDHFQGGPFCSQEFESGLGDVRMGDVRERP